MLFAADKEVSKWTVFWGASAALVVATAIGVIAGTLSEVINEKYLNILPEQDYPRWRVHLGARLTPPISVEIDAMRSL